MEWIEFKNQIPEEGRLILYGNSRSIEVGLNRPDNERLRIGKMEYKDITHWKYIDPPPPVDWNYPNIWRKNEDNYS